MNKRVIAVISDMHIGSRYALWPEKINIDRFQKSRDKLFESWKNFVDICHKLQTDTVFLCGDILHGQNLKDAGKFVLTTDLNEQVEAAREILLPLLKDRKSFWVEGSRYHSSTVAHSPEENLCKRMEKDGQTFWKGLFMNGKIEPFDVKVHMSHGESAAFIYRESVIAREILFNRVAFAIGKLPRFDLIIHGHWHWYNYLKQNGIHYVQVPCWTLFEPSHIAMKAYHRYQPDIGGIVISVSNESIEVKDILFNKISLNYVLEAI